MKRVPQGTGHVIRADTFDPERLAELTEQLSFSSYSASFKLARSLPRKVTISCGPPNSGKTYECFQKLAAAGSGSYLAPLRLLAVEGRDTLLSMGVRTNLLTGEDFESVEGARLTCSTIEMLDQINVVDVIVIDEAQQLFDPARGWAWTQAILAAPAKELYIICAPHALSTVLKLLEVTGESHTLVTHERKGQLEVMEAPIDIKDLEPGDAVVSFSRMDVLVARDTIMKEKGVSVAVVYGSLPSEVRRREAGRFASGAAPILSA
jgi:ATP-dependent RNA helicase SUPV3L1/SUV3